MQYIDDDMDDLFRKAAENYPLKTDGPDWDAFSAQLASSADDAVVATPKRSNLNYLWLLLLLVIPAAVILYKTSNTPVAVKATSSRISTGSSLADQTKPSGASRSDGQGENTGASTRQTNQDQAGDRNNTNAPYRHAAPVTNATGASSGKGSLLQTSSEHLPAHTTSLSKGKKRVYPSVIADQPSVGNDLATNDKSAANKYTGDEDEREPIPVDSTTAIRQPKQMDSVSSDKPDTAVIKKPNPLKKPENNSGGFYYGLVAGPDVSTIKSQKVSNLGYSAGGMLGYRINKHWAIEAGVLWDRKKYYSSGEYFDKTRTNIPPSVEVLYVDGSCNMFEFPLAIRYDLNLKKNSVFFTGGFTSYVMKKEDYSYDAENNGNYYKGYRSYANSGGSLFSNLQLSAGYNYNFSRSFSLRIEPYIKMPVKDIGIGRMPISSKGLYIGIFRNIR